MDEIKNLGANAPIMFSETAYINIAGELTKCYNRVQELLSPRLDSDLPESEGSILDITQALEDLHRIVSSVHMLFDTIMHIAEKYKHEEVKDDEREH